MKIYIFYTEHNEILLREWFLPTIKDDYPVVTKKGDQGSATGVYKDIGWFYLITQKVDFVIQAIRENWNGVFIFSDPDIQFFDTIGQYLANICNKKDLIFQRDTPSGTLCAGFFLCMGNERTLNFWQDVKEMIGQNNLDDQDAVNYLLRRESKSAAKPSHNISDKILRNKCYDQLSKLGLNRYRIKWGYLPNVFYGGGTLTGKGWAPGMQLPIPGNIILHHANWTMTIENKISQLEYVRGVVKSKYGKQSKYG